MYDHQSFPDPDDADPRSLPSARPGAAPRLWANDPPYDGPLRPRPAGVDSGDAPDAVIEGQWDTLKQFETENQAPCLTPRQLAALPVVAAAPNIREAAREAGIARSTLYRWLDDENFRSELKRLSSEATSLARVNYKLGIVRAFQVLDELLDHENPWVRLSASRIMSRTALHIHHADQLTQDMMDLRGAING